MINLLVLTRPTINLLVFTRTMIYLLVLKCKGEVFFGQEPPSEESTTRECGVNYQLVAERYQNSPMGNS